MILHSKLLGEQMILTIISVLIGSIVTWLVAWFYYKRAGDELKSEAQRLQKTSEMILRWLETEGKNIEIVRDSSGSPTSLSHKVDFSDSLTCRASVTGIELKKIDPSEST